MKILQSNQILLNVRLQAETCLKLSLVRTLLAGVGLKRAAARLQVYTCFDYVNICDANCEFENPR